MRIVIAGISGFVGNALKTAFRDKGYDVVGIGKEDYKAGIDILAQKIEDSDVLINLSGAPIIARWSDTYKKTLRESRLTTTHQLIDALERVTLKPSLFISTSAVGIYKNDQVYDESTTDYANDFLGQLCQEWESMALKASVKRRVIARFGIVMGSSGGALAQMLPIFRFGLGGVIGSGNQGFSWIHIDDLTNAFLRVIDDETMSGVYNFVAPQPTSNRGLTNALGEALHRPTVFPVPEFALRVLYGEGAKVLTDGQKVVPKRLLDEGFNFQYPDIVSAMHSLT